MDLFPKKTYDARYVYEKTYSSQGMCGCLLSYLWKNRKIITDTLSTLDLNDATFHYWRLKIREEYLAVKERVNIGLEMVSMPVVLFLDEPTSGLDSTGSLEVCRALRNIAEAGLTVVTVIHQPRYEIFTMFHDVLLLGKGGRTVYLGQLAWLSSILKTWVFVVHR